MMASPPVEVDQLVKRFGSFAAVDGLDLVVGKGEVHGFLGPNGAGKTTALRVLLGLYRATAGRVRVFGLDPASAAADITRRVSYVPGEVTLWPNLTGGQVLDALAALRGARNEAAERQLADDFALDTHRLVRTYSKGNRQKVMLVAAFAAPTELLVLDEPTSGLDPLMERLFQRCVVEATAAGRTVLLSSHILAEAEALCESVTIIKDGHLVESGRLADMRHLVASEVTARMSQRGLAEAANGLRALGLPDVLSDRDLRLSVPRELVPGVLRLLLDAGADDIACTPASLEDLFLRHYEVAAR